MLPVASCVASLGGILFGYDIGMAFISYEDCIVVEYVVLEKKTCFNYHFGKIHEILIISFFGDSILINLVTSEGSVFLR